MTFMSCNRNTVFYRYEHTPVTGWEKDDTLIFYLKAAPDTGLYNEEIGLRTNGGYPFMGLTLIVDQTVLPIDTTYSDTINCQLVSPNGNVKGSGISNYQYRLNLTDIRLNEGDSLHIRIRHDMKREILPGITDIGVKITKY